MSAPVVINARSISFEAKKADIRAFLQTKPDGSIWKDFFLDDSSGGTIIELLAGVATYLDYQTIIARAEAYLTYARKRSSVIAIAETKVYSAFRGQRTHYSLTFVPNFTGTVSPFVSIGTCKALDVVPVGTTLVNTGVPATIEVVIGKLSTEDVTVASGADRRWGFISPNVSEDCRVVLIQPGPTNTVVTTSKSVRDMANGAYLTLSNAVGALDLFGLNNGSPLFDTGNTFQLQFVDFGDDPSVVPSDFLLFNGTASAVTPTATGRIEAESNPSIIVNAIINEETQRLIVARDDVKKLALSQDAAFLSTNGRDVSPAQVELTYVKSGYATIPYSEKLDIIAALATSRAFGIAPAYISDPLQIPLAITVTINVLSGVSTPTDLVTQVQDIVSLQQAMLGQTLDLGLIEQQVNALVNDDGNPFVKRVRVTVTTVWGSTILEPKGQLVLPLTTMTPVNYYFQRQSNVEVGWQAASTYTVGDRIISNSATGYGVLFEATAISGSGKTGNSEPNWATIPSVGNALVDTAFDLSGSVTWTNMGVVIPRWLASRTYNAGSSVAPVTFTSVGPAVAGFSIPNWVASTLYSVGQRFQSVAHPGNYFICTVPGSGGVGEPSWNLTIGSTTVVGGGGSFLCTTGPGDMSTSGTNSDVDQQQFLVQIDSVGAVDTFEWSKNGGITWEQTLVPITGSVQLLDNGAIITFGHVTGHVLGDSWTMNLRRRFFQSVANYYTKWAGSTVYAVGNIVVPAPTASVPANGYAYICITGGTSAITASPPNWASATAIGSTVAEMTGTVVWQNIGTVIPIWSPSHSYATNAVIEAYANPGVFYTNLGSTGTSGATEPTWTGHTTPGNTVTDGGVTWTCIAPFVAGTVEPTWPTELGQVVADGTIMWQVLPRGQTGPTEPAWPTGLGVSVQDLGALWFNVGPADSPVTLDWNEYLVITPTVDVS